MRSSQISHKLMDYPYVLEGDFVELPVDTTCVLGEAFTITCSPPRDAGTARWMFNGERLFITHPPDGVTPSSFNNLFRLRITFTLARHYITVQCIAVTVTDINRPVVEEEESPPVTIRVEGSNNYYLPALSTKLFLTVT